MFYSLNKGLCVRINRQPDKITITRKLRDLSTEGYQEKNNQEEPSFFRTKKSHMLSIQYRDKNEGY